MRVEETKTDKAILKSNSCRLICGVDTKGSMKPCPRMQLEELLGIDWEIEGILCMSMHKRGMFLLFLLLSLFIYTPRLLLTAVHTWPLYIPIPGWKR